MKNNVFNYAILLALVVCATDSTAQQGVITTIAGNGVMGFMGDGGAATAAELRYPFGEAVDKNGNIYICDYSNYRIRKVTPAGIITDFAGNGSWGLTTTAMPATNATIDPAAIAIDTAGNFYIADTRYHCIYKIDNTNTLSLIAGNGTWGYTGDGGPATAAELNVPDALAVDRSGNLYICDNGNVRIRKINTAGIISTVAGNGSTGYSGDGGAATAAELSDPTGVTVDKNGNLYVADGGNNRIRKITATGIISTVAGSGTAGFSGDGGTATAAELNSPLSVTVDTEDNIYISDLYNARIRMVRTSGTITTIAGKGTAGYGGDGGPADSALLNEAYGMAVGGIGTLYLADEANARIRKIFNNFIPTFTGGARQSFTLCENAPAISLDTALQINDTDHYQQETWTVLSAPMGGIVNAAFTAASMGGTITPAALSYMPNSDFSGTDSFKIQICDGFGADTSTIIVQVVPIPALGHIAGNDTVCTGLYDTLTASVTGGTWSVADTALLAVSAAGVMTGIATGTDSVWYNVTNGCGFAELGYAVTISPLPNYGTITGAGHVCPRVPDTLTDTAIGGLWHVAHSTVDSISSAGIYKGMAPGWDTVYYGNTNVCGTYFSSYAVYTDSLPTAATLTGKDSLCIGLSDTIHASVTGGTWASSNPDVASVSAAGIISGRARGGDSVIYSVSNTCGVAQTTKLVQVETLTMGCYPTMAENTEAGLLDVKFYPNPNTGDFEVLWNTQAQENGVATIYDMLGKKVMEFNLTPNKELTIHTDVASGVYMIQVQGKTDRYNGRLVIIK